MIDPSCCAKNSLNTLFSLGCERWKLFQWVTPSHRKTEWGFTWPCRTGNPLLPGLLFSGHRIALWMRGDVIFCLRGSSLRSWWKEKESESPGKIPDGKKWSIPQGFLLTAARSGGSPSASSELTPSAQPAFPAEASENTLLPAVLPFPDVTKERSTSRRPSPFTSARSSGDRSPPDRHMRNTGSVAS